MNNEEDSREMARRVTEDGAKMEAKGIPKLKREKKKEKKTKFKHRWKMVGNQQMTFFFLRST